MGSFQPLLAVEAVPAAKDVTATAEAVNAVKGTGKIVIPNPPQIAGTSFILEDFNSGKVLAEKDADLKVEPASLTKVMTVYVIFNELNKGSLKMDELVTISDKAWRTEGSRMFVKVNERVKVEDLLQGVIIQSGNDASVALAEHVAGDEATFATLMNQHAARIGMKDSHFTNSMGLPGPDHYSTARDLAKLARTLIKEFPQYYRWDSQKEFTYNKITQPNRNLLLWRDPSVDGIKTGHTEAAGYCMLASAKRNDMRLISVVMGTASANARSDESESLLNYGFRFYETHRLYTAGQALSESRVWKGDSKTVPIGFREDFYVTVPVRHFNDLKATINVDNKIMAPVAAGAAMGKVSFDLGGDPYFEAPIVALKAVPVGGFFKRIFDEGLMLVNGQIGKWL
ncbi:MAG: D-alanyl-D-alanine carboxypeptidase [Methylococcaceae bacterium]|nr:D-alanyl-D-alanine carboxypeptidase [Methylococcaceae bacterium]